ncbi:hypothetical protein DNH61_03805 [Paenibacillus sambharensis]|uniref:SLH domain-containing protein n=1 Tax=Paenibacillus sambharensis TaxID=1803190 RepID=A0A2W1LGM0_9BACL|nr:S-layer homology domain-containing protein [Paenibacillus sambharensis]PZD97210.1 hypothetical protein DNH61_03805 [Paenibacillus sambharensis]
MKRRLKAVLIYTVSLTSVLGLAEPSGHIPTAHALLKAGEEFSLSIERSYNYSSDLAEQRLQELFPILLKAVPIILVEPEEEGAWEHAWWVIIDGEYVSIKTSIDAHTGRVNLFQYPDNYHAIRGYGNSPPKLTEEEISAVALSTIHKVEPAILPDELDVRGGFGPQSEPLFGPIQYRREYYVLQNGIRSQNETISIQVDRNGDVVSYIRTSQDTDYPSPETGLTEQDMREKLQKEMTLELTLYPVNGRWWDPTDEWKLAYIPLGKELISRNAATGEVPEALSSEAVTYIRISSDDRTVNQNHDVTFTPQEMQAIHHIQRLYPNAAEEFRLMRGPIATYEDSPLEFRFQRYYGDASIYGSAITIRMDEQGKLEHVEEDGLRGEQIKGPLNFESVMNHEEAVRSLVDAMEFKLEYIESGEAEQELSLAYTPCIQGVPAIAAVDAIDAVTGTLIERARSSTDAPTYKGNHWAAQALYAMAKHGVMFASSGMWSEEGQSEINPNDEVSVAAWQLYIYRALYEGGFWNEDGYLEEGETWGPSSKSLEAAAYFGKHGWVVMKDEALSIADTVEELFTGEVMTREQWAGILVSMLDYAKLPQSNVSVAIDSLEDEDQIRDKRSVDIVLKLGLLTATNGRFYPAKPVTKAQAATVLMRLAELQRSAASGIFSSSAELTMTVTTPDLNRTGSPKDYITFVHQTSGLEISIGISVEELIELLGEPLAIDMEEFDTQSSYKFGGGLTVVVEDEEVVWVEISGKNSKYATKLGGIRIGDKLADMEQAFGFGASSGSGPFINQKNFAFYIVGDRIIPSPIADYLPETLIVQPSYWIDLRVDDNGRIEKMILLRASEMQPIS